MVTITFASVPAGADIVRADTGQLLGKTPKAVQLPAMDVPIRLRTGGAQIERTLSLSTNSPPTHYTWYVNTNKLESRYD